MAILTDYNEVEVTSHIDLLGQKMGLYRFPNETPDSFKQRVISIFRYKSNSSLNGLRIGIGRRLGHTPQVIAKVGAAIESDSTRSFSNNPWIKLDESSFYFYESPAAQPTAIYDTISDFRIDWNSPKFSNGFYFKEIYEFLDSRDEFNWLNKAGNSIDETYAAYEVDETMWIESKYLLSFSSLVPYNRIPLRLGENRIPKGFIALDTLTSNKPVFLSRKDSLDEVNTAGDYFYDEASNMLSIYRDPNLETNSNDFISYSYIEKWSDFVYVPVSIVDLMTPDLLYKNSTLLKDESNLEYRSILFNHWYSNLLTEAIKKDKSMWISEDLNNISIGHNNKMLLSDVLFDEINRYYLETPESIRRLI